MPDSRAYSIEFHNVAVAAVQDLIGLYAGANMACCLQGIVIGQITGASVQNLQISVARLPAAVTSGAVGTAPTPRPMRRGDVAATATARANDTTRALTGGTKAVLHSDAFNTVNGYQFYWPREIQPTIGPSEALILGLDSAPSAAMTMSGTLYFGELY